jgi:PII-like signaling protein
MMLQAQIFIDKDELHGSQQLYDFIFKFLIRHKIKGATAFRGQIGFGPNQHLQRPDSLFSFDEPPMMITFIDETEKVKNVIALLRKEVKNGLITTHAVEVH